MNKCYKCGKIVKGKGHKLAGNLFCCSNCCKTKAKKAKVCEFC